MLFKLEFVDEVIYTAYVEAPSRKIAEDWADRVAPGRIRDNHSELSSQRFECEKLELSSQDARLFDFKLNEKGEELLR